MKGKSFLKISLVIVATILTLGIMTNSSYAYKISINGGETSEVTAPVVLTEKTDTIEIESTIEELVDILNAYKVNKGYKFAENASNATINAKITNMFSTEGITVVSTVAPEGAKIKITPVVKDIVYTVSSFEIPEAIEIDFTDTIIHLPETATVTEALKVFEETGVASIVACGDNYNITTEGKNNTTTVHLNKGQDLKAMFDLIEQEKLDNIIVAVPDALIDLASEETTVWLAGDLTEEEVLKLVKDLRVDATVRLVQSDEFSVELSVDKEPVVNKTENPNETENSNEAEEPANEEVVSEEKDETPKTGSLDVALYVSIVIVAIALLGILTARKPGKYSK